MSHLVYFALIYCTNDKIYSLYLSNVLTMVEQFAAFQHSLFRELCHILWEEFEESISCASLALTTSTFEPLIGWPILQGRKLFSREAEKK